MNASASPASPRRDIRIIGAHEHNLQHIDVTIPRNALTVITGLSGSGKSSLAFDTLYAEGQRRYVESLSAYARQFLDQMQKPKVEHIEGLSPAISIEQKTVSKNPRSTVGTVTEIYDYLRVLYTNIGQPHCAHCGRPLEKQTVQDIVDAVLAWPEGTRLVVLAPVVRGRKGEYRHVFEQAQREGFTRVMVDGRLRELEEKITLNKKLKHDIAVVVARLVVSPKIRQRLTDCVETALRKAEGLVTIERLDGAEGGGSRAVTFSQAMACPEHGPQIVELAPRSFSFNSPYGACPTCKGLGVINEIDPRRIVPDHDLTIRQGAVLPWAKHFKPEEGRPRRRAGSPGAQWVLSVLDHFGVDPDKPWRKLAESQRRALLYGSGKEKIHYRYASPKGTKFETRSVYEGLIPRLERRVKEGGEDEAHEMLSLYFAERPCPGCRGQRLRPESLAVTLNELNISQFCALTVRQALDFLKRARWNRREKAIGAQAIKEITDRLGFMIDVGLDYLTLDRPTASLSGGEGQRIRLATQIGSQLVGVLYVLDEPTIGLHARDDARLIQTLTRLRDLGNTVIVVEHDEVMIRSADHVIDLGPGAGRLGGHVVACGPPSALNDGHRSVTGQYLNGERRIPLPAERRRPAPGRRLRVRGARHHNLKNIDVEIPLAMLVCVTGVSGSGKSTLVSDILYRRLAEHFYGATETPGDHAGLEGMDLLDKVVAVDQSPIGRTPRSNPATYTQLLSPIRELLAGLPEARARGYAPGRFSFNVKGGRCEACEGDGLIRIEMHFLPDIFIPCETCGGRRFNRETLEILYKGKTIADVLEMTVEEACEFFSAIPTVYPRLKTLQDVGLGYVQLGQSATTLSGGEAQRVKLSRELGKRATGRTLYILDEPTTGLHFEDVRKLIEVLHRLVGEGNTVLVIEHHLDVVKCADWVIDLGPEGGEAGGEVVAVGPPEALLRVERSYTGQALRRVLKAR